MMKKLRMIGIFLFAGVIFSCQINNGSTQKQEAERLNQLLSEIKNLASSVNCEESSAWHFSSFGSKACGGPVGYIAYSKEIDTVHFLEKIKEHKIKQEKFNEKWNILSDCSVPPKPTGVICKDSKPSFNYSNSSNKDTNPNSHSKKIQSIPIPENSTK